jgi:MATE family multidrug resistance protein
MVGGRHGLSGYDTMKTEVQQQKSLSQKRSFWLESKATFLLALPLIVGQLGQMLMGVADTVMIGHVGVVPLAASTFANTLLMVPFLFGVGLLTSISIRVSQGRGGQRHDEVKHALRHGTWLALGFGVCIVLLILAILPFLGFLGQPEEVVVEAPTYLMLVAVSMVPVMVSMAWKNYGDAMNRPWLPFWILMTGVLLNVLLNWILIYGHWGMPALGLAGAGWATLISRLCVVVALYVWLMRAPVVRDWSPHRWWGVWKKGEFRVLLRLGVPIGLQLLAEIGAFAAASLMIGSMGVVALAAHQVAWICVSTSFMIPLGVAMALTVRMGEASGSYSGVERRVKLRQILLGGGMFGFLVTGVSMGVFIVFGQWLASHIVSEPDVIQLAAGLLVIAGFFQIVDGFQVIFSSALRGMGDVKVPAWLGVFAYWGIAVPLGAYLGFVRGDGASGVWWGLAFGLVAAAWLLGARAWKMSGRT